MGNCGSTVSVAAAARVLSFRLGRVGGGAFFCDDLDHDWGCGLTTATFGEVLPEKAAIPSIGGGGGGSSSSSGGGGGKSESDGGEGNSTTWIFPVVPIVGVFPVMLPC